MIRAAAAMGMFAMAGCAAAPLPPTWTSTALVNREEGVVVVWRRAEYEGGGFNGFDRDPVTVARAVFDAFLLKQRDSRLEAVRMPVDVEYRQTTSITPNPDLWISHERVLLKGCRPESPGEDEQVCGPAALPGYALHQLGRRGEDVVVADGRIAVHAMSRHWSVDLPASIRASTGSAGVRMSAAAFPSQGVLYLVDWRTESGAIHVSVDGGDFVGIDYGPALAAASTMLGPDVRSLQVVDIVPGGDPLHPRILFDWMERRDGAFVERTGVLDLSTGQAGALADDVRHPVGFWGGDGLRVLADVRAEPRPDGSAEMTLDIRHAFADRQEALTATDRLQAPGD